MKKRNCTSTLKCLAVDVFMLLLFALLIAFTLWLIWMYFLRGPIDMETRGYVSKTLKEASVQPTDVEKYTLQHFHNLDDAVLKGIEYPSACLQCHGDYPHNENPKVRAFFNAHSWFIACEVCHYENIRQDNIVFKWLDNDTDIELYKLQGKQGIYGARIVPLLIENKIEYRLDKHLDEDKVVAYMASETTLNEQKKNDALDRMHKKLNTKPISCDQCHIEKGLLKFNDLLYTETMSAHLESIDVGTMINRYKVFHFPDI